MTVDKLISLDLDDKENGQFLPVMEVNIGFAATKRIQALRSKAKASISERQVLAIKMETRSFIKTMVKRIIRKSPLSSTICRSIGCLSPKSILCDIH